MSPTSKQDQVVPDSLRIVLNQYLKKEEAKSLAPDGSPCTWKTRGLLKRARIVAGNVIPVGKETDRQWERGGHPSMLDFEVQEYGIQGKMVIASSEEIENWSGIGVRELIRRSGLSQTTVYKILEGAPVRCYILSRFRQAADRATV